MKKNADGSLVLSADEVTVLELIIGEWEEEAESSLEANGEDTHAQSAFVMDFIIAHQSGHLR